MRGSVTSRRPLSGPPAAPGAGSRPAGVFAVVSAACFLLSLAILRPPIKGYVASAIIEYVGDGASEAAAELDPFARRLEIRPAQGSPGRYSISLLRPGRTEAVNTLDEQIAEIIASAERVRMVPDRQAIEGAALRVTAAEERELRTRGQWEVWRARRAEAEREAEARAKVKTSPPPDQQHVAPPAGTQINPQWAELARQLDQWRAQRIQLLVSRTPLHPAVIDTEMRIREAEQQLITIPQFLAPDPSKVPLREISPIPVPSPTAKGVQLPDLAEGAQLEAAWEEAVAQLAAAREVYSHARTKMIPAPKIDVRVARPPEVVNLAGGKLRLGWVVAIALGSMGAGLAMARAGALSSQSSLFATIDEITQTLKIPVIASLTTGDGPVIPHRSPYRVRAAKLAARASAAMAIILAVVFLYQAAIDPLVLEIAASDPIQAYAFTVEMVWPL